MATTNSTTNLITMNAQGDTARATTKFRLAGVIAVANSVTGAPLIRLTDNAGALDIIPLAKGKSGALVIAARFDPPIEVTGVKALSLANVTVRLQVR
jgi:hypothetical protein